MKSRNPRMKFSHPHADVFVPGRDATPEAALARVTHLCIAAHQDDIEIMAHAAVCDCLDAPDRRAFGGVVVTNGAGSPRAGRYGELSDAAMIDVRRREQRRAAELGGYAIQLQLAHPSADVKTGGHAGVASDLDTIFNGCRPEVVLLHNPADKHATHVAVLARCIEAMRRLPADRRPARVLGCEVWRDLDWLVDRDKIALDSGRRLELAAGLLRVFDSQIAGGKRYDVATIGRRTAHATFHASHETDACKGITWAMDLTPLIADPALTIEDFARSFVDRLQEDVTQQIRSVSGFSFPQEISPIDGELIVGIDGGGTCTRAVVAAADGAILGWGEAAGCNQHNVGTATAVSHIGAAMHNAFARAGRPFERPAAMFVGAAGVKAEGDSRALRDAIVAAGLVSAARLLVANDSENAHAAALGGRPGVVLICGTGSIALGRNRGGRSFFSGGWGWLLDDVAGGGWLGREALHAVARTIDGREEEDTMLRPAILDALNIVDPHALLERVYAGRFGAAEFARLAPLVLHAAREGDAVALKILQRGADEAAILVRSAARGAQLVEPFDVALVGGVVRSGAPYQPMIETSIRRLLPGAMLVEPEHPPVLGALLRALALARISVTSTLLAHLEETASALSSHD